MLKLFFTSIAVLSLIANASFASTLTIKPMDSENNILQGTYTLAKKEKGISVSSDGKLTIKSMNEIRSKATRDDAYVYDGFHQVTVDGHVYTMHMVSMTESDGKAIGVFKLYAKPTNVIETGTFTYVPDKAPAKTGTL